MGEFVYVLCTRIKKTGIPGLPSSPSDDFRTRSAEFAHDIEEAGDGEVEVERFFRMRAQLRPAGGLYLKHIPFTGNHLVQHRIDEESDEEP